MLNREQQKTYDKIIKTLKSRKIRITKVRCDVIKDVLESTHPTSVSIIDNLKKEDGKINVMSVYNTLDLLLQEHILAANTFNGKQITYEIVEPNTAHFTCLNCHKVFHVSLDKYEQQLDDILQSAGNEINFKLDHYKIEGHGWCADCKNKLNENK